MDWIWTDTSLELDEWSIMEDIFKNLFQRKCELQFQANFPEFRGFPRRMIGKYMLGGAYLIMIIGAIWFPLVIFAVGGTVGEPNRPVDVVVELEISGYVPIARISATKVNKTYLDSNQFKEMSKYYNTREAGNFMSNYNYLDTTVVMLNGNSTPVWGVSPSSQQALINDLSNKSLSVDLKITWYISRHKLTKTQNMDLTVYKSYDIELPEPTRDSLVQVISNTTSNSSQVKIENIFPNFLRVPEKGEPGTVKALEGNQKSMYRSINLVLKRDVNRETEEKGLQWFEIQDVCDDKDPFKFYRHNMGCDYVLIILFNERIFPGALQIISGYG